MKVKNDYLTFVTVYLVGLVVFCSMTVQAMYVLFHFTDPSRISSVHQIQEEKMIQVLPVQNKVVMGKLAGSRNLAFGVKNMLEEYLVEKDYSLNPYAKNKIEVEILFLDVQKTQANLSVFHKNTESVVIKMRAKLISEEKVIKTVIVEESADEVSMSALLIDEGGKFNQQNLSSALKKSCATIVSKLL